MRRNQWALATILLIAGISGIPSCSEETVTANEEDTAAPQTGLIYPPPSVGVTMDVSDSIDVFVGAKDNNQVSRVEIWAQAVYQLEANLVASLDEPIPPAQVPDSLKPEDGTPVYKARWVTRELLNGKNVNLYSRAFDVAGNATRSDIVVVRILNEGGNLTPTASDHGRSAHRDDQRNFHIRCGGDRRRY